MPKKGLEGGGPGGGGVEPEVVAGGPGGGGVEPEVVAGGPGGGGVEPEEQTALKERPEPSKAGKH